MEQQAALATLDALSHATRLEAFRLLVRTGPEGLPAGRISEALDVPPPTLSFHLAQLVRAGLVTSRREGRSVVYGLVPDGVRDLLAFLTEDCCGGHPELCAPNELAELTDPAATDTTL